jgi:hypothetical protein
MMARYFSDSLHLACKAMAHEAVTYQIQKVA